ncbi:hypothetical protein, partial [Streptomyces sp. NPDC051000]|uniref:hypothetical protein n=1 Tax=Streptomyces sp. NPDC051000 TaxID=3155520 RepID=UPI00341121C8
MPNPQMNTAPDGATSSLTVLLPLVTIVPALTAMFADRLSTPANVILIVLDLALVAVTAGCFARGGRGPARAGPPPPPPPNPRDAPGPPPPPPR